MSRPVTGCGRMSYISRVRCGLIVSARVVCFDFALAGSVSAIVATASGAIVES